MAGRSQSTQDLRNALVRADELFSLLRDYWNNEDDIGELMPRIREFQEEARAILRRETT